MSLPVAQHVSEWTATFMAKWCKPQEHVSYSYIVASLDNIAQQALKILQEEYPKHSIFSVSTEQFSSWKTNMNNDNQWNKTETKQILQAICRVMFHNLGFRVFNDSERTSSSYKNFIDNVSRTCKIWLCLLYLIYVLIFFHSTFCNIGFGRKTRGRLNVDNNI